MRKLHDLKEIMDHGYITLPRYFTNNLFSEEEKCFKKFKTLCFLFNACFHVKGVVQFKRKKYPCDEGEYICKIIWLAERMEMEYQEFYRLMKELEWEGFLEMTRVGSRHRIRMNHYRDLTFKSDSTFRPQVDWKPKPDKSSPVMMEAQQKAIEENRDIIRRLQENRTF